MADVASRYGRTVMVVEVGMDWQQAAASKSMLADLLAAGYAIAVLWGVLRWL